MTLGFLPLIVGAVTALAPLAAKALERRGGGNPAYALQLAQQQAALQAEAERRAAEERRVRERANKVKIGGGLALAVVGVGILIYVSRKKRRK